MSWIDACLLRLYPRWFRERYGREFLLDLHEERQRAQYDGVSGAARFWSLHAADLLRSVWRARTRTAPADHRPDIHPDRGGPVTGITRDLRYAVRQLFHRPGFAAVAILSLAVGIGGTAAIVAFVDGFILRPFAYHEPDRVVAVGVTFPRVSDEERFIEALSPLEFLDIQRAASLTSIAAFDLGNRNISGGDRPERVMTGLALTDPFGPFGLAPLLGRGFTGDELRPGGPDVAILSYRTWQGRFGGDAALVGRTINVNGRATTVVGVMPRELLVLGADLWIPWGGDPLEVPRTRRQFTLIGRLAPGASLEAANAELSTIAGQVTSAHGAELKEYEGWRLTATPWVTSLMRDITPWARLVIGAVGFVLLIACANLSSLLLARSTTRQREIAVRLALGAGRGGVARQLLMEVGVLAVAGGIVGVLLAYALLPVIVSLVPAQVNSLGVTAAINGRVLALAALLTIGSAALVALLPILQAVRAWPQDALRNGPRAATSARSTVRVRRALVVAQMAMAVLLLAAAGLMVRSVARLQAVELGFAQEDVLTMRLTLPFEKYRGPAIGRFFEDLVDRLHDTPGVTAASLASQFPPLGPFDGQFAVDGRTMTGDQMPTALLTAATDAHPAALGLALKAGRFFTDADRPSGQVAVVNEAFADRYLAGAAPVGQRIRIGPANDRSGPLEVVGVVGNTRNRGVRDLSSPEIFIPRHLQPTNNQLFLLVRGHSDAARLLPLVRARIAEMDPDQPVYSVQTLEDAVRASTFGPRLTGVLFGVFAAVALTLAALGIYGVMAYVVSARTQEIGVRMAVGADRRAVSRMVIAEVIRMAVVGLLIGLAAVAALGRALSRSLYEVQPTDPLTLAAVTLVLGSVAFCAGWVPARRASRVDPVEALRYD